MILSAFSNAASGDMDVVDGRLSQMEVLRSERGVWWRYSNDTIVFEGGIAEGILGDFLAVSRPEDRRLIVRSPGGAAHAGVLLGLELTRRRWETVEVETLCASSCANYIFPAARNKIIRPHAWVGFHGNVTAFLRETLRATPLSEGRHVFSSELTDALRARMRAMLGDALSEEDAQRFYLNLIGDARLEEEYLARSGASQDLFDRTQRPDKGIAEENGRPAPVADFLVPTIETLARYGISNVISHSDWMPQALGAPRREQWHRGWLVVH